MREAIGPDLLTDAAARLSKLEGRLTRWQGEREKAGEPLATVDIAGLRAIVGEFRSRCRTLAALGVAANRDEVPRLHLAVATLDAMAERALTPIEPRYE